MIFKPNLFDKISIKICCVKNYYFRIVVDNKYLYKKFNMLIYYNVNAF